MKSGREMKIIQFLINNTYEDFKKFLEVSEIECCEDGKIIKTAFAETECFEAYTIVVDNDIILGCVGRD